MWESRFVILCGLLFRCVEFSAGSQCTSPASAALKFSVVSHRNKTGHWNALVQLHHEAGSEEAGPWEVNVDHTTSKCDNKESVRLVVNITAPSTETSLSRRKSRADYELVPGLGFYKFHSDVKTWYEARDICVQEGAHLTVINSQREANALLHFWVPHPKILNDWRNDWAHIGFHDQHVEGEYVTIFEEPLNSSGYIKWFGSQPNGIVTENCGVAHREASLLADVGCSISLPFFCEQEL